MVEVQSSFSSVVYLSQEEEYKDQAGQNNFSFAYAPGLHRLADRLPELDVGVLRIIPQVRSCVGQF